MKTALKLALAGASAIAFAAPGYAQTTTGDEIYDVNNNNAIASDDIIIVEGRRRVENQQDVPQTINVVTQEDLQKLNLRDGSDIASVVPGLNLGTNANGIGGNASIRGVNFDVNVSGNNPTVEFYQNDAPVTAQIFLQANYDIGQIETVRGPQGTLRGRASPSGAITIRTRRPDLYDFGGYVDATGNDIGGMNFNGAVGIPIVEGILGVRLAGLYSEDEVNRVRTINDNGSLTDGRDPLGRTRSGRASILFTPTDWLELFGSYQHLDRDARYFQQQACNPFGTDGSIPVANDANTGPCSPYFDGEDRRATGDLPFLVSNKFDIYNAQATLKFGGQNLIYTGNYIDLKLQSRDPNDGADILPNGVNGTGFVPFNFGPIDPGFPGVDIVIPFSVAGLNETALSTQTRQKSESHELRLQNEERLFDGLLDYVVGGFLNYNDSPSDLIEGRLAAVPPSGAGPLPAGGIVPLNLPITRTATTEEKSIFGNITLHPTERLELSGGIRYIDYQSDSVLFSPPSPVGADLDLTERVRDSKTIYTASASYDITDDIMAYASFGTSWRPGVTAIGCFNDGCEEDAIDPFLNSEAETSESYEIGVKSTLFGGRMRLNVTGFYQDFTNYPYRAPGAGVFYAATSDAGGSTSVAQFNFISGVPVEVKGIEAEVAYEFSNNFNIGATLAYADGKIKDGTIPCNDFDGVGGAGDGTPDDVINIPDGDAFGPGEFIRTCDVDQNSSFAAPFQASVFGEFTAPLNDDMGFFLRGLFDFDGNSKGDPNNSIDDVDAYGILNLYTGLRDADGAWEVTLFGKNIFDTYRTLSRDLTPSVTRVENAVPGGAGQNYYGNYSYISSTAPQEFGVNLRYRFGSDN